MMGRRRWTAYARLSMLPAVLLLGGRVPAPPPAGWLVVPITAESTAVILDAETLVPIVRVRTLPHPQDVVASPVRTRAFVLEMGTDSVPGHSVAELEAPSGRLVRRLELGACLRPHLGRISRDGGTLWVACVPSIVELDLEHATITRRWTLENAGAWNFDVSEDEQTLVTANFDDSSATLISRESGAQRVIRLSGKPIGIAVAPHTQLAWIGVTGTDSIYVVDLASAPSIKSRFPSRGSEPARIAFALDARGVIITNSRSNSVSIYDAMTRTLRRSVRVPRPGDWPKGVVVSDDGRFAFVSLMGSDAVIRIDVGSGQITGRTVVGNGPERAAWVARR